MPQWEHRFGGSGAGSALGSAGVSRSGRSKHAPAGCTAATLLWGAREAAACSLLATDMLAETVAFQSLSEASGCLCKSSRVRVSAGLEAKPRTTWNLMRSASTTLPRPAEAATFSTLAMNCMGDSAAEMARSKKSKRLRNSGFWRRKIASMQATTLSLSPKTGISGSTAWRSSVQRAPSTQEKTYECWSATGRRWKVRRGEISFELVQPGAQFGGLELIRELIRPQSRVGLGGLTLGAA